jgi:hypothetical protein
MFGLFRELCKQVDTMFFIIFSLEFQNLLKRLEMMLFIEL